MTSSYPDLPGDDVPAEDWAEQATDAEPPADNPAGPIVRPGPTLRTDLEANEADLAEQDAIAYTDDDEDR